MFTHRGAAALLMLMLLLTTAAPFAASAPPEPPVCEVMRMHAKSGVIYCDDRTVEGYAIVAAMEDTDTFLVDQRGEVVMSWPSPAGADGATVARLLNGGRLLRASIPSPAPTTDLSAGGETGLIEIIAPDGSLEWDIELADDEYRFHHDAIMLPNGNVVAIAWEHLTKNEAIALGRDEANVLERGLWPDVLFEYAPPVFNGGEPRLVWSWHAKDHLTQSLDESKPNYAASGSQPGRLDINYGGPNMVPSDPDWMHCNGLDYDPVHDHLLVSCRGLEEIFIVDHNTTTRDAEGSAGDVLWRWGNPAAYGRGNETDQYTVTQHDARFIPRGYPNAGDITVFSNGVTGNSIVHRVSPVRNGSSFATFANGSFAPYAPQQSLQLPSGWGPRFMSGAQTLSTGDLFVTDAMGARYAQMDWNGSIAWEYNTPINVYGTSSDRDRRLAPSQVFRGEFIEPTDARLSGVTLTPSGYLETWTDACDDGAYDIPWDKDGDGCIDDDDDDGVLNNVDECPESPFGTEVDDIGCPPVVNPNGTDDGNTSDGNGTDTNGTDDPPVNETDGNGNVTVEDGSGNGTSPDDANTTMGDNASDDDSINDDVNGGAEGNDSRNDTDDLPNDLIVDEDEEEGAANEGGALDDDDLDGVLNVLDLCPGTEAETVVDAAGCAVDVEDPVTNNPPRDTNENEGASSDSESNGASSLDAGIGVMLAGLAVAIMAGIGVGLVLGRRA
jgi:hypothetical protein